jgi:hypothetical protein
MKTPITIPCQTCGKPINLEVLGTQLPGRADCSVCGTSIYLVDPLGNVPTMLIMERAKWELSAKDITMAVLLSAMAVEAQMSWLFFKWRAVDDGLLPHEQTEGDKEKWEGEWIEMRTISKRSDELSRLLTGTDFDKFAQRHMGWLKPDLKDFDPATSVKAFFQDHFFEKRNQIVHYGNIDFEEEDGNSCFSLASASLRLLQAMDKERIKKMDDDHRRDRESAQA